MASLVPETRAWALGGSPEAWLCHTALQSPEGARPVSFVPNHSDGCACALLTQNVISSILGKDYTWAASPPVRPCIVQALGCAKFLLLTQWADPNISQTWLVEEFHGGPQASVCMVYTVGTTSPHRQSDSVNAVAGIPLKTHQAKAGGGAPYASAFSSSLKWK